MQKPLISVIVPVFNAEQYLPQCMESLLQQIYSNLQILIVDDGSSDGSLNLCRRYAESDARITVISQENKGVSAARNCGLIQAAGEYVAFVDADDWVDITHIQQLAEGLREQKYDCAICGYWLQYPQYSEKRDFAWLPALSGDQAIEYMLSPYLFQGFLWNKLFRTKLIRAHGLELCGAVSYLEDMLFCATYFSHCTAVCCVNAAGYHYRQHAKSAVWENAITEEWLKRRLTAVLALQKIQALCRLPKTRRLCAARRQMEYAEILRSVRVENALPKRAVLLTGTVRKGLYTVLFSAVSAKEKIKYLATALCPGLSASYFSTRKRKYL